MITTRRILTRRNAGVDLHGLGVPLLVAIIAGPRCSYSRSAPSYSVLLALLWRQSVFYLVFDPGLARALTQATWLRGRWPRLALDCHCNLAPCWVCRVVLSLSSAPARAAHPQNSPAQQAEMAQVFGSLRLYLRSSLISAWKGSSRGGNELCNLGRRCSLAPAGEAGVPELDISG